MSELIPQQKKIRASLKRRYYIETGLRIVSGASVLIGLLFLLVFFATLIDMGKGTFVQTYVKLDVELAEEEFATGDTAQEAIANANYQKMIRASLHDIFPNTNTRRQKRTLYSLVSNGAEYELAAMVKADPELIGRTIAFKAIADDEVDLYAKGHIDLTLPEDDRRLKDDQIALLQTLEAQERLGKRFNKTFFTSGDSREAEQAGILVALKGSLYALIIAFVLAFPIGIATVIYLEEFAPQNWLTDIIEISINNLAAVPSIIFGLLGLAALLNFAGLPRSTPLVGGIVLSLMTLPTIIIAGRAALKMVPDSIREAALSLGASKTQAVFHHVLPLGMPGILTSSVIGMAQALGETAPLLMIGMVAFIVDAPQGITDPATALPVQIYLWADSPERAFAERTAGAILVLLTFLIVMNLSAVILRNRFERKL